MVQISVAEAFYTIVVSCYSHGNSTFITHNLNHTHAECASTAPANMCLYFLQHSSSAITCITPTALSPLSPLSYLVSCSHFFRC